MEKSVICKTSGLGLRKVWFTYDAVVPAIYLRDGRRAALRCVPAYVNVCCRHTTDIENTASNDSDRLGKLNSIQPFQSVAVIEYDILEACLRTV